MSNLYLLNTFSIGMLDFDYRTTIDVRIAKISEEEAIKLLKESEFISAIGHESTAKILSQKLGMNIEANRIPVKLREGDRAIVFQVMTRLPEGKILTEEELKQIPTAWFLVIVC